MNTSYLARVVIALAVIIGVSYVTPSWLNFLLVVSASKGIVALGVVIAMRAGLVSFGQGLFFAAGAYTAGLMATQFGLSDFAVQTLLGTIVGLAIAALVSPLLSGYRGIFFATLTLALSMILYGALNKATFLGGSDGMTVPAASFFGYKASGDMQTWLTFVGTAIASALAWIWCERIFRSRLGLMSLAVRENELRVEYLGASVSKIARANLRTAGELGGMGGAIAGMALSNINPEFSFWTTSGEFVFIAVLAGVRSIPAVFFASVLLEVVKSFSSQYMPTAWQFVLGLFLFCVILFLPEGLGSLRDKFARKSSAGLPADASGAGAVNPSSSSASK